ncbi:MAG TPA: type I phosphomannose isomerase catalytic subunit [Tepidisphaeraceae bacterium]|jgi:mannose-6-phosphate isomerase|nr:type I phosphomannose isomerase catalytic subunit [Tepidisphaeraceae bacterium]
MSLYPLMFKPRFVEKIWGGRKIETVLGKPLPSEKQVGESWEIYDFPPGVVDGSDRWVSAIVINGPLAGKTLHELVTAHGVALTGNVPLVGDHGQFPILIKYLDAREDLSVQVHPPQAYADAHPGAHLKTEAWYVVQNDPGSRLLKGLAPGVTREAFEKSIQDGTVESKIQAIPIKPGDCHYLPSGTVHALGAGILVAEVQTPSDTTFRVFDFNRIEPATGKPRALHVQQAMECIDFSGVDKTQQTRSHVAGYFTTVTRLVKSPFFQIEKVRMTEGVEEAVPYDEPVVWMMLEGKAEVRVDGIKEPTTISRGDTVLLPAAMKNPTIKTLADCVWLEVTFPTREG